MLSDAVTPISRFLIVQQHGGTQGTVVEHLIILEAIGIDELVAVQQRRRSAPQRCPNLIEIHATPVVVMVRELAVERIALLAVLLAKPLHSGHHHHILYPIALFHHQFWCVL